MPAPQHQDRTIPHLICAVLTVSDTRTPETDGGGRLLCERLTSAGHAVPVHEILADDPAAIAARVRQLSDDPAYQAILLTGGTGIARRDTTYEAVAGLLEKRLDGFGELFRMLSYEQVGPAAMLSRATAGIRNNAAIFALPGSPKAVELALDKLILPELPHIAWLARG